MAPISDFLPKKFGFGWSKYIKKTWVDSKSQNRPRTIGLAAGLFAVTFKKHFENVFKPL